MIKGLDVRKHAPMEVLMKSQKYQHPPSLYKDQESQKNKHRIDLLFIAGAALFFMIWAWQWNRIDLGLDGPDVYKRQVQPMAVGRRLSDCDGYREFHGNLL